MPLEELIATLTAAQEQATSGKWMDFDEYICIVDPDGTGGDIIAHDVARRDDCFCDATLPNIRNQGSSSNGLGRQSLC